jgi:hypothetical protein
VPVEPGRLRARLHVLPDGDDGARATARRRRDRGAGRARARRSRARRPPVQRRVHGHGRAAAQLRRGGRSARTARRPPGVRAVAPAHHRLDLGARSGDRALGRGAGAAASRGLAQRHDRRAARSADADQPPLSDRASRGGLPAVRAHDGRARDLRVRAARRRQRHGGRCETARAPRASGARAGQSDPVQRGPRCAALPPSGASRRGRVPRSAARGRSAGQHPFRPRPTSRRREGTP